MKTTVNELVQTQQIPLGYADRLNELVERFLLSQDIRPNSKATYKRSLKQFILWLEQEKVQNPTRESILAYKSFLEKKGLSALTISGYVVSVRRFFEWLEGMKLYPNVAKGIKGAKRSKDFKKDPLTVEQIQELLNSIDRSTIGGKRDFALVNLLVRTALRTIEVIRANVGDISQKSGEAVLYIQGKGRDTKDEFVVLTQPTLKPILEYLKTREGREDTAPLFCSLSDRNRGKRLTTRSISKIVKDHLRKINLDNRRLTAHSLRHTAVTTALKAGATLDEVRAFARHQSLDTTLIYAHHLDRVKDAPEKKLDAFLEKAFHNGSEEDVPKENSSCHFGSEGEK